jgi:hypothetical protein
MKSLHKVVAVAALGVSLTTVGCGDDDGSRPFGPEITYFGLTRADDQIIEPSGREDGIPVFERIKTVPAGASGFSIVVEAAPGTSGAEVGTSSYDVTLLSFPDLQIQVSRAIGNGSAAVCDDPVSAPGGVPGTEPVNFEETAANVAHLNDLSCRFVDGQGNPEARTNPQDSCVAFASGDFAFVDDDTTTQYCGAMNVPLAFPLGDTVVTARLRDADGNIGEEKQILVRVTE